MNVEAKARRILADGRVSYRGTTGDIRRFVVAGDSGEWKVRWGPKGMACTCPARIRCSHELATILWWSDEHAGGNIMNKRYREGYDNGES